MENLLKLLQLLCPISNHIPSSLYKLRKFFNDFSSNYQKKQMCAECEKTIDQGESCHGKDGYLVQVPVEKALKSIIKRKIQNYCMCAS